MGRRSQATKPNRTKARIAAFPRAELKPELSQSRRLITYAAGQAARFLGHEITAQHCDTQITINGRRQRSDRG